MKAVCIIGGTGRGKSTVVKELLSKYKGSAIVYDVNNEYYQSEKYTLPEVDEFINYVENKHNSLIVFEEATAFFKHGNRFNTLEKMLIRKRHNKQYFIFVFHALHKVPADILDYIDTFVLFKTNENAELIRNKFKSDKRVLEAYNEVKNSPDFHYKKIF